MPYDTTTIDLSAEQDRLKEEYRDAEARAEELEADGDQTAPEYEEVVNEASEARNFYNAIQYLRDEYDAEELTFGRLTGGEYAQVTDKVGDLQNQKIGGGPGGPSVQGAGQLFWAGMALVDAPFIDEDDEFQARVEAVREQPAEVSRWLAHKANEASALSDALGNELGE